MISPTERFWAKVSVIDDDDSCWEWQAYCMPNGYGSLSVNRRPITAHRFAWELANGPIPDGMCVLHRCDNRRCARASHLFLGTYADNSADMIAKGRERHRTPHGEDSPHAIVTEEQVRRIRERIASGETQAHLAREHGVTISAVNRMWKRKSWKHVA